MAKKKSKFKNIVKFILDLRKTERGKAILFLGFYFVFFLVLIKKKRRLFFIIILFFKLTTVKTI